MVEQTHPIKITITRYPNGDMLITTVQNNSEELSFRIGQNNWHDAETHLHRLIRLLQPGKH